MRPTISPAAFSFHFEAEKNRFGIFSDLNFVRLSTESDFTLQGPLAMTVNGDADIDSTFFEAGASYRLSDSTNVAVIGGLRTFTLSSQVEFSTPNVSVTPIDASRNGGERIRRAHLSAALSEKVSFISPADIGGGSGLRQKIRLGQRAMACKAPRHRWHSRQPWQCGICNLQILKGPVGFESHPLRQQVLIFQVLVVMAACVGHVGAREPIR